MNYFKEFKRIGLWELDDSYKSNKTLKSLKLNGINFLIDNDSERKKNVVYVFKSNKEILYIGETTRGLKSRFESYRYGFDKLNDTDNRVKIEITKRLIRGEAVEIFCFQPTTIVQFAGETINIPISKPIEEFLIANTASYLNIKFSPKEKLNTKYQCPICKTDLQPKTRYPNYVCSECSNKASDKLGNPLSFGNIGIGGGFEAFCAKTNKKHDSHICYIEGIECFADEARFGGIVIEINKNKG